MRRKYLAGTLLALHPLDAYYAGVLNPDMPLATSFTGAVALWLVAVETESSVGDREMFLEGRGDRMVEGLLDDDEEIEAALPSIAAELVRRLPDDVRMVEVESPDGALEDEGAYWVSYYRNGMSDGFTVRLLDKDERPASVHVDPLSGKVTVDYGT